MAITSAFQADDRSSILLTRSNYINTCMKLQDLQEANWAAISDSKIKAAVKKAENKLGGKFKTFHTRDSVLLMVQTELANDLGLKTYEIKGNRKLEPHVLGLTNKLHADVIKMRKASGKQYRNVNEGSPKPSDPVARKILDLGKKLNLDRVPEREKQFDLPTITFRQDTVGFEITWDPEDPRYIGWAELEWGKSKSPRIWTSGNDDINYVLRRIKKTFTYK